MGETLGGFGGGLAAVGTRVSIREERSVWDCAGHCLMGPIWRVTIGTHLDVAPLGVKLVRVCLGGVRRPERTGCC